MTLTGGAAAFDDKNVAIGKTVTLAGATLSGMDAGNYVLDFGGDHYEYHCAAHHGQLHRGQQAVRWEHSATVLTRTLNGAIRGDVVSLTGGTATFNDKTLAIGKTVTLAGATLSGMDAGNYALDSVATTTANITVAYLTGSFTAANKVYDGNNSATVLTRTLSVRLAGTRSA